MSLQPSDAIALVALFVSLIAIVATTLQLLQQLFATSQGHRQCSPRWSTRTKGHFRLRELRYEIIFETPTIFFPRPNSPSGPIPYAPIEYINGSPESYSRTLTYMPYSEGDPATALIYGNTFSSERASWISLILALQFGEQQSRAWDMNTSQSQTGNHYDRPQYTLTAALQPRVQSWDLMPQSASRPYATTTITCLVEIAAMLGLYWRNFDRMTWNLVAEGNGFMMTGYQAVGLGLIVSFSVTGKSAFKETRLVPNKNITPLCFGIVYTIFENSPSKLAFGNSENISQTLLQLGVHPENIVRYKANHRHLFSVAFEIIGMVAVPLRIRQSSFKRVPNPTAESYIINCSKTRLMEEFQAKLKSLSDPNSSTPSKHVDLIFNRWSKIQVLWQADEAAFGVDLKETLHDALDASTEFLNSYSSAVIVRILSYHLAVISTLDDIEHDLNELDANREEIFVNYYFTIIRQRILTSRRRSEAPRASDAIADERDAIWTTLVFRMLCWLLLHDFDKEDLNIVPSYLLGSVMPVYIF